MLSQANQPLCVLALNDVSSTGLRGNEITLLLFYIAFMFDRMEMFCTPGSYENIPVIWNSKGDPRT